MSDHSKAHGVIVESFRRRPDRLYLRQANSAIVRSRLGQSGKTSRIR
jgi:hypothetical protein